MEKLFITSLLDHGMIIEVQTSFWEQFWLKFEIEIKIEFYMPKYIKMVYNSELIVRDFWKNTDLTNKS